MDLPKQHYYDAVAIACLNTIQKTRLISIDFKTKKALLKKYVADGDSQDERYEKSCGQKIMDCLRSSHSKYLCVNIVKYCWRDIWLFCM